MLTGGETTRRPGAALSAFVTWWWARLARRHWRLCQSKLLCQRPLRWGSVPHPALHAARSQVQQPLRCWLLPARSTAPPPGAPCKVAQAHPACPGRRATCPREQWVARAAPGLAAAVGLAVVRAARCCTVLGAATGSRGGACYRAAGARGACAGTPAATRAVRQLASPPARRCAAPSAGRTA